MKRTLLGMLTPSSNTILEPLTSAMVAGVPGVSAHFGRFRVTEISLNSAALGQFDDASGNDDAHVVVQHVDPPEAREAIVDDAFHFRRARHVGLARRRPATFRSDHSYVDGRRPEGRHR